MNLHVFHDDKFTDGAIEQFELHYPNQNIYIVLLYGANSLAYTSQVHNVTVFHIRNKAIVKNICQIVSEYNVTNLFIHYLDTFKASITLKILSNLPFLKFYWIFYGGDLYDYLTRYHNYDILDQQSAPTKVSLKDVIKDIKYLLWFGWTTKNALKKAFERLDYFCFWNEYDYKLFHSKIQSPAKHKDFIYYSALGNAEFPMIEKKNVIMINHSASPSGNHFHIIDVIKQIPLADQDYKILLPLSYGDSTYADRIEQTAKAAIDADIIALREFMPIAQYQNILSTVKIAIFGMKRQEAAGNIFQLLNMGTKVYLREENTLFQWLKKRDFLVFSLESDYNELEELIGLSAAQITHNRNCYAKTFNASVYQEMMEKLID